MKKSHVIKQQILDLEIKLLQEERLEKKSIYCTLIDMMELLDSVELSRTAKFHIESLVNHIHKFENTTQTVKFLDADPILLKRLLDLGLVQLKTKNRFTEGYYADEYYSLTPKGLAIVQMTS